MESKNHFSNNNSNMSDLFLDDFPEGLIEYPCDDLSDNGSIIAVFFLLIFVFSLIGNCLFLCVLICYENLKHVTNLFIFNLACSDLVFTVTLPFWAVYHLHHWVFGVFACHFMTAAYFVGVYSSVILLTAMTVDRFATMVLRHWASNLARRKRCAMGACAATWVISIAASLSDSINMTVEDQGNGFVGCEASTVNSDANLGYYLQVSLLFFLPFAIIVFCYAAILITVLPASNRRKARTVALVLCIVTAFFICWGPYNILIFVQTLHEPKDCFAIQRFYLAYDICRLLAYSHCCMNPLLYMLSQKLRSHLVHLLHNCNVRRRTNKKRNGHSTSNAIHNPTFVATDPCHTELQVR